MADEVKGFTILRVSEKGKSKVEDVIAKEFPFTIILDNQELVTLLCTPKDLKYLAIGFLSSEGLIKDKGEIRKIILDDRRGVVRVETEGDREVDRELLFKRLITSGCGRGAAFYSAADTTNRARVESQMKISTGEVFALVKEFQLRSQVYRATGGVHSAALCDTKGILIVAEDIGRHNAIDKIFGECMLKDIPTDDRIIVTSGRMSSEIVLKIAKRNIPILLSKSAPTDLAVDLAADLGVTLIGFVRGRRMNVYTDGWRVTGE
ncbi:MAG: formate dehydrogenase accessory sulfurtransferase FdhD [Dehalococcoidia bacterium]